MTLKSIQCHRDLRNARRDHPSLPTFRAPPMTRPLPKWHRRPRLSHCASRAMLHLSALWRTCRAGLPRHLCMSSGPVADSFAAEGAVPEEDRTFVPFQCSVRSFAAHPEPILTEIFRNFSPPCGTVPLKIARHSAFPAFPAKFGLEKISTPANGHLRNSCPQFALRISDFALIRGPYFRVTTHFPSILFGPCEAPQCFKMFPASQFRCIAMSPRRYLAQENPCYQRHPRSLRPAASIHSAIRIPQCSTCPTLSR